jgi:hypothetical protein
MRATTTSPDEVDPEVLAFQATDPSFITRSGTTSPKDTNSHGDPTSTTLNRETLRWLLDTLCLQPTNSATESDAWCINLVQQARSEDYVHSSLLALIALHHWRHGSPNDPDAHEVASKQYIAASNAFRSRAPQVTQDNWIAVLIFGITVLVYNIVVNTSPPAVPTITTSMIITEDERNMYEKFYDVFCLFRTTGGLGHEIGHFLKKSPLMSFIGQRETLRPGRCGLSAEDHQALDRLASGEHTNGLPEDIGIQCSDATRTLIMWASFVDGQPSRWMHFLWWPNAISPEFVKLLHQKSAPALLVFVYWCAIMHRGPQRWFLKGWACKAAYSAVVHLNGCYEDLLRWPMSELERVSPNLAVEIETQQEKVTIVETL